MKNITEKSLFDVFTQHQAYLYRASSRSVNELYKFLIVKRWLCLIG